MYKNLKNSHFHIVYSFLLYTRNRCHISKKLCDLMCHYYSDQAYYHIANNSSQNLTAGTKF